MMPLVESLARRYRRQEASFEDLRQVALLALLRAADRFDPDRGVHFATFASGTIEGELKRYHRDRTWIVRPPRSLQELHLEIRHADDELTQRHGRRPSVREIAVELDETIDHVLEGMQASSVRMRTVLDEGGGSPDGDGPTSVARVVVGCVDGGFDRVERALELSSVLERLPVREQRMIRMRYFENRSQQAIADELGVTQSYLSRLLRQMLANVAARLTALK